MKNILIDAGPLIALFDKSDSYHPAMMEFLRTCKRRLVTNWPVVTETCYMLDHHKKARVDFLTWIQRGGVFLFTPGENHVARIIALIQQYADVPMDLADASLVAISEEMNITELISIESDFDIYRTLKKKHLKNLFKS
ncbi:PIN domain-containing protein [bacterium]|nr:PIN domain-containing protein [bacterium]